MRFGSLVFLLFFCSVAFAAVPAPDNNCLSFDGENDYVALANESAYDVTSRFTIEFWIKVNAWDRDWQAIITKGDDTWRIQRNYQTNLIRFDADDKSVSSTTEFNDGEWHHLVCEKYDNQMRIYVDGVVEDIEWYAPLTCPTNNEPVIIGENSGATGRFFDGQLDDIRFWNRARYHNTSGSPPDLWNHPPNLSDANLISYFSMDDDSDPNLLVDDKGTGHGTIYGAQYVASPTPVGLNLYGGTYDELKFEYELIRIFDNISVNDSLIIDAGVTLEFLGHYGITIPYQATFKAVGTEAEPITFTVADTTGFSVMNGETDTAGSWKNLNIFSRNFDFYRERTIEHCIFEYAKATAIIVNDYTDMSITNSTFRNNYSLGKAGAVFVDNNSMAQHESQTIIDNCTFENNRAYGFTSDTADAGAIYINRNDVIIRNCIFDGNISSGAGGAVALNSQNYSSYTFLTEFYNNILINNSALNGGALAIYDYDDNTFNNNIFKDNSASNGGGIYFDGTANLSLYNNIIMGNTANSGNQIYINSTSSDPSFEYSFIEGGFDDFGGSGAGSYSGTFANCSDRDPLFVGSGDHPYDISDVSPCINAGKPGTTAGDYDFLGNDRIFTATASNNNSIDTILNSIDIGPYEKQQDSGVLPYDFQVNSSIDIAHDLIIPDGTTLTLNRNLSMDPDVCLKIYGSLVAQGEYNNPRDISRFNVDNSTDEPMISFLGPSLENNSSQLDYCRFRQPGSNSNIDYGGLVYVENYDDLLIRNSLFKYTEADYGGALAFDNSSAEINDCIISYSEARTSGGAIYCQEASPVLANLTIYHNSSLGSFAAIAADAQSDPSILNCIIWDNGSDPLSADLDVKYSNIEGGYNGVQNLDADPCFESTYFPESANLRLKPTSPCLNAGTVDTSELNLPDYDYFGNPRIHPHSNNFYNRVDMGAYEYPGLKPPTNFAASDGDNNYPGSVYLSWDFDSNYVPLNGFQIYRNDVQISTVSPQSNSFSDLEATPGEIFTYSIAAYAGSETSIQIEDPGYLKPNGIITGTVLSTSSNPVAGVKVTLAPTSGYCIDLNSETLHMGLPGCGFDNTTFETWLKTTAASMNIANFWGIDWADTTVVDLIDLSMDAAGHLQYSDGVNTIYQQVDSLVVNDGEWHHLAVVTNADSTITTIYIDGNFAGESSLVLDHYYCNYLEVNQTQSSAFIDDIKIWNIVRTQEEIIDNKDLIATWNAPGLQGYWAMNEGTGDICFDATNNANLCDVTGTTWSTDEPGIALGGITNNWGEYSITQIPYGNYTTFTVTPHKTGHYFQPEQRLVTLSGSNISQNNVDFTDDSMIPISGYVSFQDTEEWVEDAHILLNGAETIPPTITGSDGYYVMDVEHGTDCVLSVDYHDHEFNRVWDLGVVTFPQSYKNFEDVTRTCYIVEVFGGDEHYPIGAFDIEMTSMSGLHSELFDAADFSGQWAGGSVIVDNIPPLNYHVTVTPNSSVYPGDPFNLMTDQQFLDLHTQDVDLRYPDLSDTLIVVQDTLTYVWYNELQVAVEWPDDYELKYFPADTLHQFYVVPQNEWITLEVTSFEDYEFDDNGHVTYLDNCDININDEIGPTGETESAFVDTTIFVYEFAPYLPNLLSGGDRPYQNKIEIQVYDAAQDRYAIQTDWAITEGAKPQESTFSTTSPEIPFLILHDPPGDQSYASFNQSSSQSTAFSVQVDRGMGSTEDATISLGLDIVQDVGLMYSVQTEVDVVCDLNYNSSMEQHQSHEKEQLFTFTTTEEFTTSADEQLIGLESDLFVGGAINLLWGLTKELAWNDTIQNVEIEDNIMVTPDGFETMYIYTESQIRQNVIPNCYAIGDTASAVMWQSYLDMNLNNIDNAVENPNHPGNISFNAGAGYTYEETTSSSTSNTFTFETTVSDEFGGLIGGFVNGVGGTYGYSFETSVTYGNSTTQSYETQNTMTYILADNDEVSDLNFLPDYFTVDIKKDPVYGTPVFDLISGVSSNRWEPETTPRAGVAFGANTNSIQELEEGEIAAFLLMLGNDSRTMEDRRYYLTMHHGTNPGGAIVKINGFPLMDAIPIDIPGGETANVMMTVEQGPSAYVYDGLKLEFYDLGDRGHESPDSLVADHDFYAFQEFDVSWEPPYSKVSIFSPNENWIINAANDDTMEVILKDYDLSKPTFESIKFQYKHPYDDTWFTAEQIYRDELEQLSTTYCSIDWDVSQISDGEYLIRAGTTDSIQVDYYCQPLPGHIDRDIPEVLGLPKPADGILSLGDEISVSFTEFIDQTYINPNTTSLVVNRTGDLIDIGIDCFENKVVLNPNIANINFENETLTATVCGIKDLYGNILDESVEWEFYVNANPVHWESPKIEIIKPFGESMQITTHLINSGGQFSSWSIQDSAYCSMPEWLTADVYSGTLLPLDNQTINFTISSELSFGTFVDTVEAFIPALGVEPLVFEVSVLANPPDWAATQLNNYDLSMTITGELFMEGELSNDTNDIIGAFIENDQGEMECRGYAALQLCPYLQENHYQFYLTIHSNEDVSDDIEFRVWDHSTAKEHFGITEEYQFSSGAVIGTILDPETIHVSPELFRTIECREGWTWLSVNLENQTSMSVDSVLSSLTSQHDDLIKNQTSYAQYVPEQGWLGDLTQISTTEMVKLKLTQMDVLEISGLLEAVDSTAVDYNGGWNWIGYLPHYSFSVNEALADISNAVTGDLIKNQAGYAQYVDGYGWFGSLLFMHAGEGYMLNTHNEGSFFYPDNIAILDQNGIETEYLLKNIIPPNTENINWQVDPYEYEYSSNITSLVSFNDSILNSQDILLGAFCGDECRGVANLVSVQEQWTFFLTQYSNSMNDTLSYKIYFFDTDETFTADESFQFVNNQIIGDPLNPFVFHIMTGGLSVPQNVQLEVIDGEVQLSWNSVSRATSYSVYSSSDPQISYENWTLEENGIIGTSWSETATDMKFYFIKAVKSE